MRIRTVTSAINPMTTIVKSADCINFYELTSPKGKQIGVNLLGRNCTIYLQSARGGLSKGKKFGSLGEALETYKNQDIKAALYALLED